MDLQTEDMEATSIVLHKKLYKYNKLLAVSSIL